MQEKISIIVPVYNVGSALESCLQSIQAQSYSNIEVVLIDDGSTDQSGYICDKFAENDKRFITVHQKNQGVSLARNAGLKIMSGKYVMFVDADDYLDQRICEVLLEQLHTKNCQIVIANKVFHSGNQVLENVLYKDDQLVRTSDKDLFLLDLFTGYFDPKMNDVKYLSCGVTAKLFMADIITNNNISFKEDCHFGEDVIFNLYCFENAHTIGYINFDGYHFRINPNSSTHRFRDDWNTSHMSFMDAIDEFIKFYNKDKRFLEAARMMKVSRISSLAVSFYFHKNNPKGFWKSYSEFVEFVNMPQYRESIKMVSQELLTKNQKKAVFFVRYHLLFPFAIICWVRNRVRRI